EAARKWAAGGDGGDEGGSGVLTAASAAVRDRCRGWRSSEAADEGVAGEGPVAGTHRASWEPDGGGGVRGIAEGGLLQPGGAGAGAGRKRSDGRGAAGCGVERDVWGACGR